jgi:hypothetical protein
MLTKVNGMGNQGDHPTVVAGLRPLHPGARTPMILAKGMMEIVGELAAPGLDGQQPDVVVITAITSDNGADDVRKGKWRVTRLVHVSYQGKRGRFGWRSFERVRRVHHS